MDIFIFGLIVGATLAIVGDLFAAKYLTKVEVKIKADVAAVEALKKPAEDELDKMKKAI